MASEFFTVEKYIVYNVMYVQLNYPSILQTILTEISCFTTEMGNLIILMSFSYMTIMSPNNACHVPLILSEFVCWIKVNLLLQQYGTPLKKVTYCADSYA